MDYTTQNLVFKVKKLARYVQLYGLPRTLIKVKGQYHMKKQFDKLPERLKSSNKKQHIGIIGCGNFAFSNIAYYLCKNYDKVIRGAMDINIHRAASLFKEYNLDYYTDDANEIILDPQIDLIYIASNHASHAEYAIMALEMGKSVHIEKPHVVNFDQLTRLCSTMLAHPGKVSLGFNRPISPIGKTIKKHLDLQSGPAMFNWFVAGHEIASDHWYFKEEEGGRILGNLCHWTDLIYQMIPCSNRYPIKITPSRWEQSDCDIAVTYVFGDGSIAVITFSAKGHTFSGVREQFSAHRGNVLINMQDFKYVTIENIEKQYKKSHLFRNHGHEDRIRKSYELVRPKPNSNSGCTVDYVWEAGELFLKTKEALEKNEIILVESYNSQNNRAIKQLLP